MRKFLEYAAVLLFGIGFLLIWFGCNLESWDIFFKVSGLGAVLVLIGFIIYKFTDPE